MDSHASNFDQPEAVVIAFIKAMNAWELFAAGNSKRERASASSGINREMDAVFSHFCTSKDRAFGHQGSFQSPPEYDPLREVVIKSTIESARKALVDTRREAVLSGGEYRYVLHRTDGKWLIDNLKFREDDGSYSKAIL